MIRLENPNVLPSHLLSCYHPRGLGSSQDSSPFLVLTFCLELQEFVLITFPSSGLIDFAIAIFFFFLKKASQVQALLLGGFRCCCCCSLSFLLAFSLSLSRGAFAVLI